MFIRQCVVTLIAFASAYSVSAQYAWQKNPVTERLKPGENLMYTVEAQSSLSDSKTPLWLNANKHGLSSLDRVNGYVRGKVERSLGVDSARRWALG